ncbi:MAG TPA: cytochrome P450, partial [Ktedonobacteraceae bacterium]
MVQYAQTSPTRTVSRLRWHELFSLLTFHDPLNGPVQWARKHGDVIHIKIRRVHIFLLFHPDDIRELLVVKHEDFYKGDGVMKLDRMLGRGLVTSEGELHRRQRRLVQPAFHRQRIAGYAVAMAEAARQQALSWQDGTTVDMTAEMMQVTLAIVGKTLFNTDVENEADAVRDGLMTSMEAFRALGLSPIGDLIERLPLPINARLRQAREKLDKIIYHIIDEHRRAGIDQGDLLSMLLAAQDEDGSSMSDQQLRDEVMTLFLAGHETTSHALAWTWYALSQNPEVLAKLQKELDTVLAGRTPTMDDISQLPYTQQVLTESMRHYPPIWAIDRRAIRDTTIGDVRIPKGARVVMNQYAVHHDSRFYPDPERFDPERWTPEAQASRPKFSYFPFGGGPRLCIGEQFAWTEETILLATLAQQWEAHVVPGW